MTYGSDSFLLLLFLILMSFCMIFALCVFSVLFGFSRLISSLHSLRYELPCNLSFWRVVFLLRVLWWASVWFSQLNSWFEIGTIIYFVVSVFFVVVSILRRGICGKAVDFEESCVATLCSKFSLRWVPNHVCSLSSICFCSLYL